MASPSSATSSRVSHFIVIQRQSTPRQSLESITRCVAHIATRSTSASYCNTQGCPVLEPRTLSLTKKSKTEQPTSPSRGTLVRRNLCTTTVLVLKISPYHLARLQRQVLIAPSAVICLAPRKVDGGARLARTLLPSALKAFGETCIGPCHTRPNRQPHIPDIIHHDRPPRASIPSAWLLA